ncbi:transcription termination factor 3, mitochondrial [Aricia agestis]|uniref:transcription termination factor 3, mitochondrial n=1 Tax=Aricia agestis TaxID=91739 RepID=UPI001C207C1C|nr:transcription termination factor 3, mitochondrial [Aricia agestis]
MKTFREFIKFSKSINQINILQQKRCYAQIRTPAKVNVLERVSTDVSDTTPYFPKSFNLAAYINSSETLQNLLNLNVDLNKLDKRPYIAEKILKLDFEKDMKQILLFLNEFLKKEDMGTFLSKNPMILTEDIDNLHVRIHYLQSKQFNNIQITKIILKNPFWLMYSTVRIDRRLGYFQSKFDLSGNDIRNLATKQPKIITYNLHHINTNSFVIKEEMGYNDQEIKQLILHQPKLWMICQKKLLERFNYIHNTIKISHENILLHPNILLCRNFKIKQRHIFLQQLGRAQFDPSKENYVPIMALAENTDVEFCKNHAKCHIDEYNRFLKTL